MDVFGTEHKELSLFHYVCHVVVRTIAAVADIDILSFFGDYVAVNHVTESPEFIFVMDRLDQGIRISVGCEIIKSIQMHTVDASDGIAG